MKRIISVISLVALFVALQMTPFVSAVELPVSKTLLFDIPAPWGNNVPAEGDFKVFQCGMRVYLVWQVEKEGGYEGQKVSKLWAVDMRGGGRVHYPWKNFAEDTDTSVVRFTGTCVGERAVMTNHWESPVHATAGDMATSVTGEETFAPSWQPDGRTIHHWYKTDGSGQATVSTTSGTIALPRAHTLSIGTGRVSLDGTLWRIGNAIHGSADTYALEADGTARVLRPPEFRDLGRVDMTSTSLHELHFNRVDDRWVVRERQYALDGSVATEQAFYRRDEQGAWNRTEHGDLFFCAFLPGGAAYAGRLRIQNDGLYFEKYLQCSTRYMHDTERRIHVAATPDVVNAPRVYAAPTPYGVGPSFSYGVRTGDGKIQIWNAIVR